MRGQPETRLKAANEAVAKLDNKFFRELEKNGRPHWPEIARSHLKHAVENFLNMTIWPGTVEYRSREFRRHQVRKAAAKLHKALAACDDFDQETFAIWLGYRQLSPGELVENDVIREDADRMLHALQSTGAFRRYKWGAREHLDYLLVAIARLYAAIGGRVTISQDGPFGIVLKEIFAILPPTKGLPASPEAFVEHTEQRRQRLQKAVDPNPLTLVDLPKIGFKFSSETG